MPDKLLQLEKASYQVLLDSIKDHAVFLIDVDETILSWNEGAEKNYGYSAEEVVGQHFSIFYPEEESAAGLHKRNLKTTEASGQLQYEGWQKRKDGSLFWANIVYTALKNEQGKLVGFGKVIRDITRRKKAEEEIHQLNQELATRLEKSQSEIGDYKHALDESSIVAITNQKGIITHVNQNFCNISKYSKEELLGQDHRIINSGHHSKEFIRNLWVTIANGKIWRGELKNKAKDGSFYWVDTTIVPFLNKKGKPYQYLAIRSDITQRKLVEEQLYKSNEELENKVKERTFELTEALEREKELSEMKSRFVSMASHEFRTPLSAILSSVSLLEHYVNPDQAEKRFKHIDRIKSSVRNLTSILDDFLSLEKLEQGKVKAHNTDFDLREFITDVVEEMDGMVKKKNQKILLSWNGENNVRQDKKILRNILLNLLSNAVKYSPEYKTIFLTADVTGEEISIKVRDEGIGIPAEAQKELFSKFHRANNAIHIQGTGLGLHIVKRYVELPEGGISFKSREAEGTSFEIRFPRFVD
jgi:PAS domain S-box-containing protein